MSKTRHSNIQSKSKYISNNMWQSDVVICNMVSCFLILALWCVTNKFPHHYHIGSATSPRHTHIHTHTQKRTHTYTHAQAFPPRVAGSCVVVGGFTHRRRRGTGERWLFISILSCVWIWLQVTESIFSFCGQRRAWTVYFLGAPPHLLPMLFAVASVCHEREGKQTMF